LFDRFKKKTSAGVPDFSTIDSREKIEELLIRGKLERLLLLPKEFGGEDIPQNVVFVPVGIGTIKADTDRNVIAPLAAGGTVTRYVATPNYAGKSHIPISIDIAATDPGQFSMTIRVWGEGLVD
jgi:hypothetical protein